MTLHIQRPHLCLDAVDDPEAVGAEGVGAVGAHDLDPGPPLARDGDVHLGSGRGVRLAARGWPRSEQEKNEKRVT